MGERRRIHKPDDRKVALKDLNSSPDNEEAFACDWTRECEVCESTPVVNATGLCGPCTWGESETAGGNW